jgi:putative oxidoreductase
MNTSGIELQTLGVGLLVARLVVGLVMAAHGTQKLFGWFGGYGLNRTGEFFVHLGFQPGRRFAAAASVTEITSGLLIAFGLLGPVGPALMVSVMIVAAITVHWEHGLFAANNGIEVPLLYSTAAIAFALIGFGRYSLDSVLGIDTLWTPTITAVVLAAGVAGGLANLALRHRPAVAATEPANADRNR